MFSLISCVFCVVSEYSLSCEFVSLWMLHKSDLSTCMFISTSHNCRTPFWSGRLGVINHLFTSSQGWGFFKNCHINVHMMRVLLQNPSWCIRAIAFLKTSPRSSTLTFTSWHVCVCYCLSLVGVRTTHLPKTDVTEIFHVNIHIMTCMCVVSLKSCRCQNYTSTKDWYHWDLPQ